jgi:uncharacterized protein YeaO (DUF488 family)
MPVRIKRVYDAPAKEDGERILVDRLWPRGLSKEKAHLDEWMKDIAPSPALRQWFGHKPERWEEFRARYRQELEGNPLLDDLSRRAAAGTVTLLYGARDEKRNQAVVLAGILGEKPGA